MKIVPTYQVYIYIAGDLATAQRVCREHAYGEGACVTVASLRFIYTGGEEDGVMVGLVNYPRFPITPAALDARAETLARKLLPACNQRTCLLVGTELTRWLVVEPPGASP